VPRNARKLPRAFSTDNPKACKALGFGWLNAIHYMAPHALAGVGNLCPQASEGCKALCLGWYSGQADFVRHQNQHNTVRRSRIRKARLFMQERGMYVGYLKEEIAKLVGKADKEGLKLCVRLNGSTDIAWESVRPAGLREKSLIEAFPEVQFTDYTKVERRAIAHARGELPRNLNLTFSRSETNEEACLRVLAHGGNVAVVFASPMPPLWHGYRVINGDKHDLRHLDARSLVVGLTPKGRRAKRDRSGFVVPAGPAQGEAK
jgi:hypothetical protein